MSFIYFWTVFTSSSVLSLSPPLLSYLSPLSFPHQVQRSLHIFPFAVAAAVLASVLPDLEETTAPSTLCHSLGHFISPSPISIPPPTFALLLHPPVTVFSKHSLSVQLDLADFLHALLSLRCLSLRLFIPSIIPRRTQQGVAFSFFFLPVPLPSVMIVGRGVG